MKTKAHEVQDPRQAECELEMIRNRFKDTVARNAQHQNINTGRVAVKHRMSIGPVHEDFHTDLAHSKSKRISPTVMGRAPIPYKSIPLNGTQQGFLSAAKLASEMQMEEMDGYRCNLGPWDWYPCEDPEDALTVVSDGEDAIREYQASVCLANEVRCQLIHPITP